MRRINIRFCFLLQLLLLVGCVHAQCLEGNCEDGIGAAKYKRGLYRGNFKDGQPNGQGTYVGIVPAKAPRVDSVRDEGLFIAGVFMKGKRTIIHSWEEIIEPSSYYNKAAAVWTGSAYRFESVYFDKDFGKSTDFPLLHTQTITEINVKGKKKETTVTSYLFDEGRYTGEMKNGLPNGKGSFARFQFAFSGQFLNGVPVAQTADEKSFISTPANYPYDIDFNEIRLQQMEFKDGKITRLAMIDRNGQLQYTLKEPIDAFAYIFKSEYDGFYEVTDVNGSVYTGMINNWRFNGSGKLTYPGHEYKGGFSDNKMEGVGSLTGPGGVLQGLFIRNEFQKGIIVKADSSKTIFPVCVSGNCENGKGKMNLGITTDAENYKMYEGNIRDGLPNGSGILTQKNDKGSFKVTGNFIQGMLNGQASYEGNIGQVTRMSGNFINDTLKKGTVYYSDHTAWEFDMADHDDIDKKKIVFITSVDEKHIRGVGKYYTAKGAAVTGNFYLNGSRLFEGVYADQSGNRFKMGYNINGDPVNTDELDQWGVRYVSRMKADEEAKTRAAADYALAQKRAAQYADAEQNPANFKETAQTVKCSVCNGKGYILSGYAVGSISYVSQEYMDKSGNWRRDLYGFVPAHNVVSRTPCEACNHRGSVNVSMRKYIGPQF